MLRADFQNDGLRLPDYSYPSSSIRPDGTLPLAVIRDADPTSAPPELRLITGETIFVSAVHRHELERFCGEHGISLVRRPDIWGALLEPFLDTEFTTSDQERTGAMLLRFGLDSQQVDEIRSRVRPVMRTYNFESMLWDWTHLGLSDLLDGLMGEMGCERHRLSADDFATTYSWAMELADRSAPASTPIVGEG